MRTRFDKATRSAIIALCATLALCSMEAPAFEAWPVDALVKVLPDFTKPPEPADKVFVAMARGETEAGQVAFRGKAEAEVSASITPLRSDSGAILENVKAQFLNYHSVPRAQWPAGAPSEFLKPPDEFPIVVPDAFCPDPAVMLKPDQARSLWIIVETKPDTPAGEYRGVVKLEAGDAKAEIPVEVRVFDAVVPAKRSLKLYNWLFWNGGERGWGRLRVNLGSTHWNEGDWAFVEQMAANLVAHRQNTFMVPLFYNVLCGPEVHSMKVVWKNAPDYNLAFVGNTLRAIIKKGGEAVTSGRDPVSEGQLLSCSSTLMKLGNELSESAAGDADEQLKAIGDCMAELDKARAEKKHKFNMDHVNKALQIVNSAGLFSHGVMGRRDPDDEADADDERNVFERECEFDFSIFDRASDIFLKHEPDGVIVGGWLGMFGGAGSEITPGSGETYMRSPAVPIFNPAGNQVDLLPSMDSGDIRYIAFLKAFLPALVAHLKDKGRMDKFMMGLCDETFPNRGKARVMLANEIRKFAPEIKYNDANRATDLNVGSVDLWFPLPSHLECYIDFYRARQAAGEEVGYYTCVTPGGYNMNRFVDFPLIKTRLLHWHNYRFGTTGFLHWGYNASIPPADIDPMPANGDYSLIYRDAAGNLVSSIRQASQRDGIEDYELLKVVEAKDPEAAQKLCAAIVTDCREYTRDVPRFRETRELLLAAAGPGDIDSGLREKILALEPDHFTLLKDMPKDAPFDEKGWKLVYECGKFKPEDLGADWIVTGGDWKVEDGVLKKEGRGDGRIFFAKGAGRDQKMEFTAWSDIPYPNDLSAMLCGELKKEIKKVKNEETEVWVGGLDSSFFFGFGGEGNAFSKFMVNGVEFRVMPKKVEPGRKHKIVCRREGNRVTHIIDGEVLLDAESMVAPDGEGNVHPGFYLYDQGCISDVKIYSRGL